MRKRPPALMVAPPAVSALDLIWDTLEEILKHLDRAEQSRARWSWERGPHDRAVIHSGYEAVLAGATDTVLEIKIAGEFFLEECGCVFYSTAGAALDSLFIIEHNGNRALTITPPLAAGGVVGLVVKKIFSGGTLTFKIQGAAANASGFWWRLCGFERYPEVLQDNAADEGDP